MQLVAPERLVRVAGEYGFRLLEQRTVVSAGGKHFEVLSLRV